MTKPSLTPVQDATEEALAAMRAAYAQKGADAADRAAHDAAIAITDALLRLHARWRDEGSGNGKDHIDWMMHAIVNAIWSFAGSYDGRIISRGQRASDMMSNLNMRMLTVMAKHQNGDKPFVAVDIRIAEQTNGGRA